MDWLYIVAKILALVVLVLFARWVEKNGNSPVAWTAIGIGCVLLLLWLKGWLGDAFILVMAGLDALDHIPRWIGLMVAAVIVGYYIRFIISAFAQGLDDIALEQQKINARIEMMEDSVKGKLDDIASRLPKRD
jgi:hypothetical protein